MTNARPFWTSTLQKLSNDTKNTSRRGVLPLAIELSKFESPGGLQIPNFGSVSFILTLGQSGVATGRAKRSSKFWCETRIVWSGKNIFPNHGIVWKAIERPRRSLS
jgi:hypothetical protein